MQSTNTKIKFEYINDYDERFNEVFDLANPQYYEAIVLSFGNGINEQARVVGESKAGVFTFLNLIERGGYKRNNAPNTTESKLYRNGDACFPEVESFIFVSPDTEDGEHINFENYEQEIKTFVELTDSVKN